MKNRMFRSDASILMMLLGSLLLGFFVFQGISEYNKENFILDELGISDADGQNFISTELDLNFVSSASEENQEQIAEVKSYIEEEYTTEEEIEVFYSRLPIRISIPSIGVDASIYHAQIQNISIGGKDYRQWLAPLKGVGWHFSSAPLGGQGNTVLNGHHNIGDEVFKELHNIQYGAEIVIQSPSKDYVYKVDTVMILPERYEKLDVRLQNAKWIQPTDDERITLVTCWPYTSNTHRVIVIAYPVDPTSTVP